MGRRLGVLGAAIALVALAGWHFSGSQPVG
jgi:hypothetical protein